MFHGMFLKCFTTAEQSRCGILSRIAIQRGESLEQESSFTIFSFGRSESKERIQHMLQPRGKTLRKNLVRYEPSKFLTSRLLCGLSNFLLLPEMPPEHISTAFCVNLRMVFFRGDVK